MTQDLTGRKEEASWCIGEALPEMTRTIDPMQIFMFSAVTWNRHLIHYHRESARAEGHGDVVVQRLFFGNLFEQYIKDWTGNRGELVFLEWKIVRSAFPGDLLLFQGEVAQTAVNGSERLISCAMRILNGASEFLSRASARIKMPV